MLKGLISISHHFFTLKKKEEAMDFFVNSSDVYTAGSYYLCWYVEVFFLFNH